MPGREVMYFKAFNIKRQHFHTSGAGLKAALKLCSVPCFDQLWQNTNSVNLVHNLEGSIELS